MFDVPKNRFFLFLNLLLFQKVQQYLKYLQHVGLIYFNASGGYWLSDWLRVTSGIRKWFGEKNRGKVFELEIEVNRNRYEGEMEYAVGAMSSICQYARVPFDKFVVVMVPTYRGQERERLEATAACSINYFVHKRVKYQRWVKKLTSITKL